MSNPHRGRGPFDDEFERGYVPMDEPPGITEREYAKWKEAGGQVVERPRIAASQGQAPVSVQGSQFMDIGIAYMPDRNYVMVQFHDPDWWMHLTPDEARYMAGLLVQKAEEIEKEKPNVR